MIDLTEYIALVIGAVQGVGRGSIRSSTPTKGALQQ